MGPGPPQRGNGSLPNAEQTRFKGTRPGRARENALYRALDLITENVETPLKVSDLCREAGASERSLQYAFQEHFGLSPRRFMNAYRLLLVREKLLAADPSRETVGDLACSVGYWHAGQFAADYRRLFGELPSVSIDVGIMEKAVALRVAA